MFDQNSPLVNYFAETMWDSNLQNKEIDSSNKQSQFTCNKVEIALIITLDCNNDSRNVQK